jgi:hypothetical protein
MKILIKILQNLFSRVTAMMFNHVFRLQLEGRTRQAKLIIEGTGSRAQYLWKVCKSDEEHFKEVIEELIAGQFACQTNKWLATAHQFEPGKVRFPLCH